MPLTIVKARNSHTDGHSYGNSSQCIDVVDTLLHRDARKRNDCWQQKHIFARCIAKGPSGCGSPKRMKRREETVRLAHLPAFLTLATPVVGTAAAARLAMARAEATALICMFGYICIGESEKGEVRVESEKTRRWCCL